MARRGLVGSIAQVQRDAVRAQQAYERAQLRSQREAERARRAYERAQAADQREQKRLYHEARSAEVDAMNERLEADVAALEGLLAATLGIDDYLDFESMKPQTPVEPFAPPSDLAREAPRPELASFMPPPPSGVGRIFGKAKHDAAVTRANADYAAALAAHTRREQDRQDALERLRREHATRVEQAASADAVAHKEIDLFREAYERGEPQAIVQYFTLVLEASVYPDGFPQRFRMAYVPESRQLVVEYELPAMTVVPEAKAYKYVKAKDDVSTAPRPVTQQRALYASVVAQVTLRTIDELFESDRRGHVETIVFNGCVDTVDPGTGRPSRPCLITVRTTRDVFETLDLGKVDPAACLRHLNASVSKSPAELAPVKPILEFDMVDPRFVESVDVLTELDQRPNLMELTPKEFESLITNLFERMGLETRQTQPSRDGGVDCVAYDPRPIFGGKVVIQAKRYKGTVGVSAVRDLFGTMQNEGASKGILVTTSGYGSASFTFANGKPLELIDGSNLLYLLAEHAQVEAKIQPPRDWTDPPPGG